MNVDYKLRRRIIMDKYEYMLKPFKCCKVLNNYGQDGWKFVNLVTRSDVKRISGSLYLKIIKVIDFDIQYEDYLIFGKGSVK